MIEGRDGVLVADRAHQLTEFGTAQPLQPRL